jgi:hypothetical protein
MNFNREQTEFYPLAALNLMIIILLISLRWGSIKGFLLSCENNTEGGACMHDGEISKIFKEKEVVAP